MRIRVPQVRVIDETGAQLGVMDTNSAIKLALERKLDLVEVSPKAVPPVCRLLDYGKFKYEELKKTQKQRRLSRPAKLKGIRLSMRISDHDLDVKVKLGLKFLERGDKVRVDILLRGRENLHPELAFEILKNYERAMTLPHIFEQPPKKLGSSVTMIIRKK